MIFNGSYSTANNHRQTAPNHIGINNNRKRNSYCYTNNHRTKNYSFWVSREYFWVMQENAPLVLWYYAALKASSVKYDKGYSPVK